MRGSRSEPPTSSSTSPAVFASTSRAPTSPLRSRSRRRRGAPPSKRRRQPSVKSASPGGFGPRRKPNVASRSAPSSACGKLSLPRGPLVSNYAFSKRTRCEVRWGRGSMATNPTGDRQERRPAAPLGFPRSSAELDPRIDPVLLTAVSRIAPGTQLRQGIDDIIRAREGALIVIGEPSELSFLFSGGIRLDQAFTPQLLYELAKMDGAIIVNSAIVKIAQANVQLMPEPTIPANETGTRHRTADRVARQTKALVVSISQQRETVTVFIGRDRYQLDPIADVLAKTNQALATLETYRQRLDQVLTRLTALEFQNAVMLDDVLVVLQRAELTTRMADYIERACTELGSEGRLIRMQLEEHVSEVPAEKAAIVYDYHADGGADRVAEGLEALAQLPYQDLLEFELLAVLGYPATTNPLDYSVAPRGYRVLTHIPRLPENVIHRLVGELSGLEGIIRASQRDLEAVDGVGTVRAREIREGLRRLQEHNLVDRYLQL